MKKIVTILFILLTGLISLQGCFSRQVYSKPVPRNSQSTPVAARTEEGPGAQNKLVSGYTQFGFELFSHLYGVDGKKNIFVSPLSIAIALSMTYNGAAGETKVSIARTIEIDNLPADEINSANKELIKRLRGIDPAVLIAIANSIWCSPDEKLKQEFIRINKEFFDALVKNELNLASINKWVSENTGGKIAEILREINSDTALILLNAVYFKGSWSDSFKKEDTKEGDFHLLDGTTKKCQLMRRQGKFRSFSNPEFQAVYLPYGNRGVGMYIFLPRNEMGLDAMLEKLNRDNWELWTSSFKSSEGELCLPRFKCEYEKKLNDALITLGMGKAFDRRMADFSGISEKGLFISEVRHKSYVEVNEEGTEAAAVTAVLIERGMPDETLSMKVDHPFFFAIAERKSGAIIFMGTIVDPQ